MTALVRWSATVVAVVTLVGRASAQEPIRAGVVGAPPVGAAAPALVLPYFTPQGGGPPDQPFRLAAELGRVVVLVFGPGADTVGWRQVAGFAEQAWRDGVTVGVVREGSPPTARLASVLGAAGLKLLPDSVGRAYRGFGVRRGRWGVVVVDDAGRVAFRGEGPPGPPEFAEKVAGAIRRGRGVP